MEPMGIEDINNLHATNEKLQAENDKLKSENETLRTNSLQIQKWLEEERTENDKLQHLYQDDHCELLDLRNFRTELKTEIGKFTCEPKDCGMNQPDWNGEVYGCDAGEDGKDLAGCPAAMANFIIKKIKESEEKYNEPTKN